MECLPEQTIWLKRSEENDQSGSLHSLRRTEARSCPNDDDQFSNSSSVSESHRGSKEINLGLQKSHMINELWNCNAYLRRMLDRARRGGDRDGVVQRWWGWVAASSSAPSLQGN